MINAQNLLFDLDGTISDSKEGITKSIAYALERMGQTPPHLDLLEKYIGWPFDQVYATLLDDKSQESIKQANALYRHRYVEEGRGMIENALYPEIVDVLVALKNGGKRLFIATLKPHPIATKVINHFGLTPLFEKIYGPELDGTRNEKSDLVSYILSCENVDPQNTVMIGDRKHDIVAALKNNVPSIGVLWGYGSAEELQGAGATALCDRPSGLLNLL